MISDCEQPRRRPENQPRVRAAYVLASMLGLCMCGLGPSSAGAEEVARGFELYMSECSKCHGIMNTGDTAQQRPANPRTLLHVAFLERGGRGSCDQVPYFDFCPTTPHTLAFAMPYGPSLEGVVGRQAGTLPGYEYSKAFKAALSGTTWNERTIDEYISDAQKRAPGIRMFYRQSDAEIRRLIIVFLKSRS